MDHRVSPSLTKQPPTGNDPARRSARCGADAGMQRPGTDLVVPHDGLIAPTSPGVTPTRQPTSEKSIFSETVADQRQQGEPNRREGQTKLATSQIANRHNARKSRQERETSSPTPRQPTTQTEWGARQGLQRHPWGHQAAHLRAADTASARHPRGPKHKRARRQSPKRKAPKSRGGLKGGQSPTPAASDQTRAQRREHPHKTCNARREPCQHDRAEPAAASDRSLI